MEMRRLKGQVDPDGHLRLDVPTPFEAGEVELVLVMSRPFAPGNRYDFHDLVGKLEWSGDPLAEQQRIRTEW